MKRPRMLIGTAVLATALAGSVAVVTQASAATDVKVTKSIQVTGTFDGGGKRYIGSGDLGSGGQAEGQDPLFNLAGGATLRNVILGSPAADGVHCAGSCTLKNVVWQDGRMANSRMTDYIMPTSADIPPIRVLFAEAPYEFGPFGAKGIGELPMDGPAPAILNAIEDALGVPLRRVPATPEAIMAAVLA